MVQRLCPFLIQQELQLLLRRLIPLLIWQELQPLGMLDRLLQHHKMGREVRRAAPVPLKQNNVFQGHCMANSAFNSHSQCGLILKF